LVNAVLRQAVREPWPAQDGSEPLWLRFSHPRWLVERWTTLLGEDVVASLLASDQEAAPLALLTAVTSADALTAGGCTLRPHPYVPGVAVVTGAAHVAAALLGQGRGYAMDPHAVVVARSLPDISGTVLDLAAAPGGKSLVLACERPELRLVALDRHPGRAAAMRRTLGRLAGRTGVAVADAARPPLREGRFGAVLLDAPCSGTGTLRRHPEIRWRLQPRDLIALTELQCALAAAAARLVEPGGVLLYSTCSLEPEENARVVETLGLEPMSPPPEALAGVPHAILSSGGVMLLPGAWGDGFTVHLLRRGERLVTRGRFA
jgi:16S rRNA (cytosine967-C5)-methyltransferase